jgi:hypothetical protein
MREATASGAMSAVVNAALNDLTGFGSEVDGLRSRITLERSAVRAGEPVRVAYVVRNVSDTERTVWHCGFWPNHRIIVRDEVGNEPPLTNLGREARAAFDPTGKRRKNFPVRLYPGTKDVSQGSYDLTTLFDLSRPGNYSVQYVYEESQAGWSGRLESNIASFRVSPP